MNMKTQKKLQDIKIKLLGIGSSKDKELKNNLLDAIARLGLELEIVEVRELEDLLRYDISSIPAIVINDEVICEKVIPSSAELVQSIRRVIFDHQKKYEMKKILVPTDFSPNAQNAAVFAINLANHFGSTVCFLHTYQIYSTAGMLVSVESYMQRDSEELMEKEMALFESQLRNGAQLESKVIKGDAISLIQSIADKGEYDLIVMGTQGSSSSKEIFLGSVTNGVLKKAKTPILAIPSDYPYKDFSKIVLTVDAEPIAGDKIIEPLLSLAAPNDAKIEVLHYSGNGQQKEIDGTFTKALNGSKFAFHYDWNGKSLNESIDQFVEKENADLLCMIRRKRGFWESLFHNSQTSREALHSPIPLLILQE